MARYCNVISYSRNQVFGRPVSHSPDFPKAEFEELFRTKQNRKDALTMFANFSFFLNRKEYDYTWMDGEEITRTSRESMLRQFRKIRTFMPKNSFAIIHRKELQNDPQAMLDYGDCLVLGLKGQERDTYSDSILRQNICSIVDLLALNPACSSLMWLLIDGLNLSLSSLSRIFLAWQMSEIVR